MYTAITSAHNPRIKNLVRLRDSRHRRRQLSFLIDGFREAQRAQLAGCPIETGFFCPEFFRSDEEMALIETLAEKDIECVQLSTDVFKKVAYRESPDGLLFKAKIIPQELASFSPGTSPLIAVVEKSEKPGNLGALIRTANAAGVDALLVCDPVCDLHNPNVIRASQGSFFDLRTFVTDSTTARLWLESHHICSVAMTPEAKTTLWETELTGPIAIVVGAEDEGLTEDWLDGSLEEVRLPMAGIADSLNVSVAAGIALFEAVRQRNSRPQAD